jgi:hypothetical protein
LSKTLLEIKEAELGKYMKGGAKEAKYAFSKLLSPVIPGPLDPPLTPDKL